MNSHFDFFSLQNLVPFTVIVVAGWFWLDMRSITLSLQRKNQLAIEGRWKDLEDHHKATAKAYRPFVWFYRRFLMPGNNTAQYALFLHNQGRAEEALAQVNEAIRQINGKPRIFQDFCRSGNFKTLCACLRTKTLILAGLGAYDEAREAAAQFDRLTGSSGRPNTSLALLEYYCGHLDEALALAQTVPAGDPQYETNRDITSLVFCTKGEFDRAIEALEYQPGDISKFYSPDGLKTVRGTAEGAKLIELQNKKRAGVFQPARLLHLAQVHLAREDFESADRALNEAEKLLSRNRVVMAAYHGRRACCLAGQGKTAEAESSLERLREIVKELPKRSLLWETHFAACRSYFHLGRFNEALAELAEAERLALHPIEKHITAYWLGRTHEAAGNRREAARYYQAVVADAIPSWMGKKAAEAIAA